MTNRLDLPAATWLRVSNKQIIVELVGVVFFYGMFLAATVVLHLFQFSWAMYVTAAVAVLLVVTAALVPRRVHAYGYQLRDDDLVFRQGIMFLRVVAVPYGRMQLVDINRGPLSRVLGLSELKFVTAAASTGVTIPGLREADAEELRDRLVALAESRRAGL